MDNPHSPCSCGMDTLVPLDLSTRKSVDMSVVPRRPLGVWSGGAVKEVKLEVTESESGGEKGVCKDQACLPLRKRRYPPPPEEEGPPAWKYYATYMAVALPPIPEHYQGTATYLPSALPLYPASALLGVAPHPAMLPPDTQLQADITAAARQDEDGDTPMHISVVQGNILAAQRVISLLLHGGRHLDSLNNLRQ
ncbi:B-cell lymphoma 3 protein-like, partial [Ascaphus truei]|uniref:B-cell lymphoma 3 protein-like n=1 Tax=Ascaphus truei TaxID=8439 RepID=UPI003F5ABC9A